MFIKPKPSDTEEDVLKQQDEFYKKKGENMQPIIQPIETSEPQTGVRKTKLVGDVVERKGGSHHNQGRVTHEESGFPQPFAINETSIPKNAGKKSIFALQLEKNKNMKDVKPANVSEIGNKRFAGKSVFSGVDIGLAEIHEENIQKLKTMSEEEILKEQKLLLNSMDSNLIEFLKKKRKKVEKEQDTKMDVDVQEQNQQQPEDPENITEKLKKLDDLNKWLSIGVIEKEKLEWVGDIPDKAALDPDKPYTARFDFKGGLLPYTTEIDVRQALHHHGEEPQRPGYTLQELFQLSRSSVYQQRILAFNTLSNIIHKCKLGYYDCCFDGQLIQKLTDSDFFLLLRFSLDENTEPIVAASVNCLYRLVCDPVDEICLDKCLGINNLLQQPNMSVCVTQKPAEEVELKDDVLFNLDLIKGILRSDLLLRFNYLLTKLSVSKETKIQIIEILSRIARHSYESCCQIVDTPGLLDNIYKTCIISKTPYYQSIKLFRILFVHQQILVKLITKYAIVDKLLNLILVDNDIVGLYKEEFFNLKLECLYTWQICLYHGQTLDSFQTFASNLIRLLLFYFEKVDYSDNSLKFDFNLLTSIVGVINIYMKHRIELPVDFFNILFRIFQKWLTQFLSYQYYNFNMLKSLGSLFDFFTCWFQTYGINTNQLAILQKYYNSTLSQFLRSKLIQSLFSHLKTHSVLFSNHVTSNRSPNNYISMNAVYLNGENYIEILQDKSPFPFIVALNEFVLQCWKIDNSLVEGLQVVCALSKEYLSILDNLKQVKTCWWIRLEMKTICSMLRCNYYYTGNACISMVFKLLNNIQNDDNDSLKILFDLLFDDKSWEQFNDDKFNISNMKQIYSDLFVTEQKLFTSNTNFNSNYLPIDWIYTPITNSYNMKVENIGSVRNCLKFIYLTKSLNYQTPILKPECEYCRLGCVFLTDMLFDETVEDYLGKIVQHNLSNKSEMNFNNDIAGISSFYDFYTELLNQYSAVSYGNTLFTHFILIPLFNRFDVSYRKLIWSEYLHVLRVVTISNIHDGYKMIMSDFVEPMETDYSLLMIYLHNIGTNVITRQRNGFIYSIALHNLRHYLTNFQFKENQSYQIIFNKVCNMKNDDLKRLIMSEYKI